MPQQIYTKITKNFILHAFLILCVVCLNIYFPLYKCIDLSSKDTEEFIAVAFLDVEYRQCILKAVAFIESEATKSNPNPSDLKAKFDKALYNNFQQSLYQIAEGKGLDKVCNGSSALRGDIISHLISYSNFIDSSDFLEINGFIFEYKDGDPLSIFLSDLDRLKELVIQKPCLCADYLSTKCNFTKFCVNDNGLHSGFKQV
jgi:hypothetical protein